MEQIENRTPKIDKQTEQAAAPEIAQTPERRAVEWEPNSEQERVGLHIVQLLQESGAEAYFVGGYGRDLLMSQLPEQYPDMRFNPNDIDIATSLPYQDARAVLEQGGYAAFKETGENFKVLNVIIAIGGKHAEFEIATFRTESDYGKNRKPMNVRETRDIREDVARRDFTIGALYFDPVQEKILDYVGGMKDIEERVLRTVNDPYERLVAEDPMRMLRYVRFRATYNMKFDRGAQSVMREHGAVLADRDRISPERVKEEFDKILKLPRAAFAIADMARLGLLEHTVPEVYALIETEHAPQNAKSEMHREGSAYQHTLETMRAIARPEFVAQAREKLNLDGALSNSEVVEQFYKKYGVVWQWANLLHDAGKAETQEPARDALGATARHRFYGHEQRSRELLNAVARRLRFSNQEKQDVAFLVENHMSAHNIGSRGNHKLRKSTKAELFRNEQAEALLFLSLADDIGNFTEGKSAQDAVERFSRAWKELQGFREQEKARERQGAADRQISNAIVEAFFGGEQTAPKKGSPIIGLVKEHVRTLLDEGELAPGDVERAIADAKQRLDDDDIDYLRFPGDMEKFKQKVSQIFAN